MTRTPLWLRRGLVAGFLVFLAVYHLADYPTTWFDEGSHLHVPKTLVRFGVYADHSSDGFRHFGPTLGVGPTVMLPIAAVFKVFGVGLVQARLVMVAYLLGALYLFYRLARMLDRPATAGLALAFLISSPAVALFENGRQVLGEVPAFCLMTGALLLWFKAWDGSRWRLILAGVLFGAAALTKYQFLIALMPMFAVAAVANYAYYRTASFRLFLWPAVITLGTFGFWQAFLVLYLGPQTSLENLAAFRAATAGAATVFSVTLMKRGLGELVAFKTFGGFLAVGLLYGAVLCLPRTRRAQQWGILFLIAVVNFGWYVVASISWLRYAFPALAISSVFMAKFFVDLLRRLRLLAEQNRGSDAEAAARGLATAVVGWAVLILLPSLVKVSLPILRPPQNSPEAMAAYLNHEVPSPQVIETWEPELGFLTTHNYHYPPTGMLNVAVRHIWSDGPAPRLQYHPLENDRPSYVVVGSFAKWVDVYPEDVLARDYRRLTTIGGYELYQRQQAGALDRHAP